MEKNLPEFLIEKIEKQYDVLSDEIIKGLKEDNIEFSKPDFFEDGFIIEQNLESQIRNLKIYEDGKIYMQSLSSMMPVLILEPKEKENILDMCSAPRRKN